MGGVQGMQVVHGVMQRRRSKGHGQVGRVGWLKGQRSAAQRSAAQQEQQQQQQQEAGPAQHSTQVTTGRTYAPEHLV
jgi:hypothetical protein